MLRLLLLAFAAAACAEEPAERLEEVRSQIRDLKSDMASTQDEIGTLQSELQQSEAALAAARRELAGVEARIAAQLARLDELRAAARQAETDVQDQRAFIAAQINAVYRAGRHDTLKLLLNQEDPALIGRMLVYHDYFLKARTARIAEAHRAMERGRALQDELQRETLALEQLRAAELAELRTIEGFRAFRTQAVERLRRHQSGSGRELQALQADERELIALLRRLKDDGAAAAVFGDAPPFASLKGSLAWPVPGSIVDAFGAPKKGGRLRAQGVTIAADEGAEVHAVGAGRVVFADWFRNLGLLLIVDHGAGFMSLYGHNALLLKKPGDAVQAGDVVARVGDTGGQERAGLYFELRSGGDPVDPALWCRR